MQYGGVPKFFGMRSYSLKQGSRFLILICFWKWFSMEEQWRNSTHKEKKERGKKITNNKRKKAILERRKKKQHRVPGVFDLSFNP